MSYINNNQKQIITKTKKIIITKKYNNNNINTSPQKIINSNQIYNRRMVSPQRIKFVQKSPNKFYNVYQTEEIKENNDKNINDKINNDYNIIYSKEDFNNNKYYQNYSQDKYDKENSNVKIDQTFTYDIFKNKNSRLIKYNYNNISPKKNSKILLKNVICNPIIVSYTEIKDAELKSDKEYKEEIEETEISIKNKIITIWENNNKITKENDIKLLSEENSEKKYIIETYEKKIKELNETILNLSKEKEKEQNKKKEFLDNIIQTFNFEIKPKKQKLNIPLSKINVNDIYIPPNPKFKNIKQNINSFNINKISKPKNKKQSNVQFHIKPSIVNKIENKIEKINDIYIPKQKIKFTFDSIYGQELCILSKKKKKIFIMQNITNISILKKEKAPPLFEAESIEKIFLSQDDNFFLKRFQQNNKCNKINDIFIPRLIKPENIFEKNIQLYIEPTKKSQELFIEYQDSISLNEILDKNIIYEIQKDNEFIIEGEDLPLYEIEKKDDFYNYIDIKYNNDDLDIKPIEDIFYYEIPKTENEIEQLNNFSLIKEKKSFNEKEIEKIKEIEFELLFEPKEENFEYYLNKNKKTKTIHEFETNNINIEDTANFQIIAMSIRELYQQKLQGFSIIKKEKQPYEIQNEIFFSITKGNYKEINTNKKILKNNKFFSDSNYDYNYNDSNTKNINTVISKNNKTFIAYPKNEIKYINKKELFNENNIQMNNYDDLFHSGDESLDKNNCLFKTYMNNNNENNEINKRYKNKIILRKNNNSNNSYNSDNHKRNILSFNTMENKSIQSVPDKIKKYQYNTESKTFTDSRLIRRKIYRFEEGKEVKIIKK